MLSSLIFVYVSLSLYIYIYIHMYTTFVRICLPGARELQRLRRARRLGRHRLLSKNIC